MSRFFFLWAGLGIIATVVTYLGTLALFRHIDLTFTQFTILLVAPAAQAAVLTWPAGVLGRAAAAVAAARRHPLTAPVLLIDLLMLAAGVAWWSSSTLGFGAPFTAQATWIGVKAVAAAAVSLAAAGDGTRAGRAAVAAVLVLVGVQALGGGLERMYALIDHRAAVVPEVFLRLICYGALYGGGVITMLRTARTRDEEARFWVTVAVVCSVPGVLLVVLSMFNSPAVMPPWRGLALVCASAGVTALVLSVLTRAPGAGHAREVDR